MVNSAVEIAIQAAGEASAYAAKFGNRKPLVSELVKLQGMIKDARWAVDAAFKLGGLTAEDEWQLVTQAAIQVETLAAVNASTVKGAKDAASMVRAMVAQASDLEGVTKQAKASLAFVDDRAKLIIGYNGKATDKAPDWSTLTPCPGAPFWEPCPGVNWWIAAAAVAALFLARKYKVI